MEHVYQQNVETSMSRALPDIAYYMLLGLACGSILESIMPQFDEKKDSVALFLEIFAQITIIVFAFMFINSKCGGRNGVVVSILILVGCQPTLFRKIDKIRENVLGPSKKSKDEPEHVETPGATSIDKLPKDKDKSK